MKYLYLITYLVPSFLIAFMVFSTTRGNYKNLRYGDCVKVTKGFYTGEVGTVHWIGSVSTWKGYSITVNFHTVKVYDVEKIQQGECKK